MNGCPKYSMESLLCDDHDPRRAAEIEQHIENCGDCQQRLTAAAADQDWWTSAAAHLSTLHEIDIAPHVQSRLTQSSSFVVSTLAVTTAKNRDENTAEKSIHQRHLQIESDWQRMLDPPTHPEILGRIDQFEIEGKIGAGGMGIVLKGFDRNLNRAVAIKILTPHLASNGTSRKRFAREAQAAAAVVHPNVIPIYAVNSSETRPYIVMQLVSGHSLQSLVQEKGPLEINEIVRIAIQVAAGLAAAHQQGLIHRDIKPANILIEHDVSRVVITDFGLARAADDAGMTQTGWIAGTPHYMSPEQSRGESLDTRSDLFSLGGLMYFLATGREPFRGDKPFVVIQKIINEPPVSPQSLNSDIPSMLSDIIEKLLEKNPADRFASAIAVQDLLQRYLAYLQQPQQVNKPHKVLTRRRRRTRNQWIIGWMSAILVLIAASVSWLMFAGWMGGNSRVTTFSEPTIPAVNVVTDFSPYVVDNQFVGKVKEVDQQVQHLELQMQQTSAWNTEFGFETSDQSTNFTIELQQLQAIAAKLERIEMQETEQLKKLLEQASESQLPEFNH